MNGNILVALSEYDIPCFFAHGFGKIYDYEVSVFKDVGDKHLYLSVSTYLKEAEKTTVINKINDLKIRGLKAKEFEFGLILSITVPVFLRFINRFNVIVESVFNILRNMSAPNSNYCPLSGEEIDMTNCETITYPTYGFKIKIKTNCLGAAKKIIENRLFIEKKSKNHLVGVLGLLIGGISAVVISFVFALNDYLSIIPGLSALLGLFLYKKFRGKEGVFMIIMSIIISIVFVFGSLIGCAIFVCNKIAIASGVDINPFKAFEIIITNSDRIKKIFILTMIMNFLEIIVSESIFVGMIYHKNKVNKLN